LQEKGGVLTNLSYTSVACIYMFSTCSGWAYSYQLAVLVLVSLWCAVEYH